MGKPDFNPPGRQLQKEIAHLKSLLKMKDQQCRELLARIERLQSGSAALQPDLESGPGPDISPVTFEEVLDNLPVGLWVADRHGRLVHKNPQADRIWLGDAPLLQGIGEYPAYTAWFADSGKQLLPEDYPLAKALMSERAVGPVELSIRRLDGSRGTVLVSGAPIRDKHGRLAGAVGINLDITEQRQSEQYLLKSQERLRLVASNIHDTIFFQDKNLCYQWIYNPSGGLSESQVVGKTDADLLPPEEAGPITAIKRKVLESGSPENLEIQLSPGGIKRWYEASYQALRDSAGDIIGLASYSRDISRRKEMEAALHLFNTTLEKRVREQTAALGASEAKYHSLLENISDIVFNLDAGYRIRYVSPGIRHYGWDPDALKGRSFLDLVCEEDRKRVATGYSETMQSEVETVIEFRLHVAAGGRFAWMESHAAAHNGQEGASPEIKGILRDVSERKEAANAWKAQRNMLSESGRTDDMNVVLHQCLDAALRISGMECGGVYIADKDGGLFLAHSVGLSRQFLEATNYYAADDAKTQLISAGKSLYIRYEDLSMPIAEALNREGLRTMAIIPILHTGYAIGCLNVASREMNEMPWGKRIALETIASAMGLLIVRNQSELELRQSEARYRKLFEVDPDAIIVFDALTRQIVDVNPMAQRIYGYSHEQFLDLTIREVTADLEDSERALHRLLSGECKGRAATSRHRKKDGSVFPVEIAASTFTLNGRLLVFEITRDISERRRIEERRSQQQLQLRQLAARLAAAQDTEQRRIAEGLHDDVAQVLAVCNMKLGLVTRAADAAERAELCQEIGRLIKQTAEQLRSLSFELASSTLYRIGLSEAIVELCDAIVSRHGVDFRVTQHCGTNGLDDATATVLFKAVRELLFNVVKHAGVKEAAIHIDNRDGVLAITVEDNGKGFPATAAPDVIESGKGLGLFGIRERIKDLGGALHILSSQRTGTRVTIEVPLKQ